jgi:hypothetical protein
LEQQLLKKGGIGGMRTADRPLDAQKKLLLPSSTRTRMRN